LFFRRIVHNLPPISHRQVVAEQYVLRNTMSSGLKRCRLGSPWQIWHFQLCVGIEGLRCGRMQSRLSNVLAVSHCAFNDEAMKMRKNYIVTIISNGPLTLWAFGILISFHWTVQWTAHISPPLILYPGYLLLGRNRSKINIAVVIFVIWLFHESIYLIFKFQTCIYCTCQGMEPWGAFWPPAIRGTLSLVGNARLLLLVMRSLMRLWHEILRDNNLVSVS
jgi:hypothetical protein